ncbi:SIMPL domain-containing protein [Candidatus Bathyarchaeota archaeon]|nr:SIMPL domain-containing protein [Candidatus Bathyarchaeota archaeon]
MKIEKWVLATALVLLAALTIAAAAYIFTSGNKPTTSSNIMFPTGVPSIFGTVSAADTSILSENTIAVSGLGSASMQADKASVILGVQTEDKQASEAIRQNAETMNKVIAAIKALGISEDAMKTVSYNVYPVYSRDDYSIIVGYRVENLIAVETTDTSLVGEIIDAAAENGANRIQGISFSLSEEKQEQLKTQAYMAALEDAEQKAQLIADKLGLSITGVLYVSESSYQPYQPYYDLKIAPAADATTPILEGKLSVSVTVNIIYTFSQ